ncbi:MAG TPA: RDD family protein [Candidatus Dormibacteraeota bacterium]|nr:RDD family protein [Candidatus Dormibacteraeota bacterium]
MEPLPTEMPVRDPTAGAAAPPPPLESVSDGGQWRDELSARLNRYRARRKAPPPRYPSLKLPFGPADSAVRATPVEDDSPAPAFEAIANHALALDATHSEPAIAEPRSAPATQSEPHPHRQGGQTSAKIIEFPRFAWGPPPPPLDQLAEPVVERPRILEVPDAVPPLPALGGITIEPARGAETEKRPGIDVPLQSARLAWRLVAALVDGLIIAAACALFGFIFWKVTAVRLPRVQAFALAAGITGVFWAAYQYLLMVYAGTTPGLRAARLELTCFDGSRTRRSLRRWRVLASYLSAASLGMGYAWLFLDEDELCWHDRITHTYLAPVKPLLKRDELPQA